MRKSVFLTAVSPIVIVISLLVFPRAYAKVTGQCANCHTMHNSQEGTSVARASEFGNIVAWTADSGALTGGTAADAGDAGASLVVTDCVGCHSSTDGNTIIEVGGSRIPVVYNMVEPAAPLAGGNFYWVNANGDEYGHNVHGISREDGALSEAPGNTRCSNGGCHYNLITPRIGGSDDFSGKTGCQGCHVHVSHHESTTPNAYRFCQGHSVDDRYVIGKEDPDWEANANVSTHNEYKGDPNDWGSGTGTSSLDGSHNMSAFCKGCHGDFHTQSDGSTWIRHPSDAVLPDGGEYALYTHYNPIVPVARPEDDYTGDPGLVRPGTDMVMCLSCHRPHGSPYPDILRWEYTTMNAGGGGSGGCFACHTTKNGL